MREAEDDAHTNRGDARHGRSMISESSNWARVSDMFGLVTWPPFFHLSHLHISMESALISASHPLRPPHHQEVELDARPMFHLANTRSPWPTRHISTPPSPPTPTTSPAQSTPKIFLGIPSHALTLATALFRLRRSHRRAIPS